MAIQVSIGAGSGFNFPRLTFSGFKTLDPDKSELILPVKCSLEKMKRVASFSGTVVQPKSKAWSTRRAYTTSDGRFSPDLEKHSSNSTPALEGSQSEQGHSSCLSAHGKRVARLSKSDSLPTKTSNTTGKLTNSNSDSCLKQRKTNAHHHGLSSSPESPRTPTVIIATFHSTNRCGTNTKSWYIRAQLSNVTSHDDVTVSVKGFCLTIRVKYGPNVSMWDRVRGRRRQEASKQLRFAGLLCATSLRTCSEKNGQLVIHINEEMI